MAVSSIAQGSGVSVSSSIADYGDVTGSCDRDILQQNLGLHVAASDKPKVKKTASDSYYDSYL